METTMYGILANTGVGLGVLVYGLIGTTLLIGSGVAFIARKLRK